MSSKHYVGEPPVGLLPAVLSGFDHNPDLVAVFEGPDMRFVAGNAAVRSLLPAREFLGRPVDDVLPGVIGHEIVELYQQVQSTGKSVTARERPLLVDGPDGAVERILNVSLAPWRDGRGHVRGVVSVGCDVTELVLARRAVEERSRAAERRLLDKQETTRCLQDALLPATLPLLPRLDLAARYLLAVEATAAGGDWFDAVPRPGGRVALVVGDVVGHGIAAAAAMAQLQAVLHERLASGATMPQALAAVDATVTVGAESYAATVCVLDVTPSTGEVEYCTAGHPPPLLLSATQGVRYLPPTGAAPLGTGSRFSTRSDRLAQGEVVVLYTDGLVERPGRSAGQSTTEFAQVALEAVRRREGFEGRRRTADRVCEEAVERLTRTTGYTDDITVLAAQRVAPVPPFSAEVPARPESAGVVRRDLGRWLAGLEVRELDEFAVQHAVGELVANALEHAYADQAAQVRGEVRVEAELDDEGTLVARVRDRGRWQTESRGNGRGLAMARALVDRLDLDRTPHGTTATLRRRLVRPAVMLTGSSTGSSTASRAGVDELRSVSPGPGRLDLVGPVDLESASALRLSLGRATRGGTQQVVVDLTGVTVLASAGVAVLHEMAAAGPDGRVELVAAAGSVAQHVLELVGLPYGTGKDPDWER